jgi:hypothetical protein
LRTWRIWSVIILTSTGFWLIGVKPLDIGPTPIRWAWAA